MCNIDKDLIDEIEVNSIITIEDLFDVCSVIEGCRYICVTVDTKESKRILQDNKFISFIITYGDILYLENIFEEKKNLPQKSFFSFVARAEALEDIKQHNALEGLFFLQDITLINDNKKPILQIVGFAGSEFEPEALLYNPKLITRNEISDLISVQESK